MSAMSADAWSLYRQMLRSRLFEEAVAGLWREGAIAGEMHSSAGEEAVVVGVVDHLRDGDALALDHRGTAPLLVRGVDPGALLHELLGHPEGLCRGRGGHMHLFSPEHLAASSGIVGAAGPAAAGFALAAQHLRPEAVAVAFFGDGALNQGMLLESFNLAVAWSLPVLFVCKDDGWAITTRSDTVTGGTPIDRARGFGMRAAGVDGLDVEAVWAAAGTAIEDARRGRGPTFLHARCAHVEGHFLGDPLLRIVRNPVSELPAISGPLLRSMGRRRGSSAGRRTAGLATILGLLASTYRQRGKKAADPLGVTRRRLAGEEDRLDALEASVVEEVQGAVAAVLGTGEPGGDPAEPVEETEA